MCRKEQKTETMLEKIQYFSPAKFLYKVVTMFANTGNVVMLGRLQTPFGARHESTGFYEGIVNRKGANPYPQLERGRSISPTR